MTMDLNQFCSRDESRPYLTKPFSRGDWTYATNGHICVRVPRIEGVGEIKPVPGYKVYETAEGFFRDIPSEGFKALPPVNLPDNSDAPCAECDGRGSAHDCPSCQCPCSDCDGTGHLPAGHGISVGIGGAIYHGRYIAQLQALPGVTVSPPSKIIGISDYRAAFFRFDGGEGILMPLRRKSPEHIETDRDDQQPTPKERP